jgi:hypothetical protein
MITATWYRAQMSPQDATSTVGGNIDTGEPISGVLDEIFEPGASRFLGRTPYQRFRKIFFRNEGNEITDAVAFWADSQHVEQMYFAFEQTPGDTSTNSVTMPSGYETGDFYSAVGLINAIDLPSQTILANTGQVGFWIMQIIPNGLTDETGALASLAIAGIVGA